MKKYFLLSIYLILVNFIGFCNDLTVHFNYSCFCTNDGQPYIETYLSIPQYQLQHVKNSDGLFVATVQVTMLFMQNDSIAEYNKYEIQSQAINDTVINQYNILDQQRLFLDNGDYTINILIKDKNDPDNYITGKVKASVNFPDDEICSSTICLIDTCYKANNKSMLTRSGYDLIPYFTKFYPENRTTLTYYNEIYNLDKYLTTDSKIVVYTQIENFELPDEVITGYTNIQKATVKSVLPTLGKFNISSLPSGNYTLVIKVKNEEGKDMITTKKFFQRSNPAITYNEGLLANLHLTNSFAYRFNSIDSLKMIIKSFTPKATDYEKMFIYDLNEVEDVTLLQNFVYHFWSERDELNPEKAFNDYMREVAKVNRSYGNTVKYGYETDRGRVYLQYGAPNHIHENKVSPSTLPYEIWQYYEIAGQRNKRFVFASMDAATKDYNLIHSDVFGELSNPKWQYELYLNAPITDDETSYDEMWGVPLDEYYDDPH